MVWAILGGMAGPQGPNQMIPTIKGVARWRRPPFPRSREMREPWTQWSKQLFSKGVWKLKT